LRWLYALLCAGILGCGTGRTGAVRVDPALTLLVPNDTVLLVGINMDALRKTPWYQKSVVNLPLLDEFANQTGLDVRKDLWEALLVSDGVHSALLARGRFSEQGMEPDIKRPGMTRTPYKGHTLIGNDESAFTFVSSTSVIAGRPDSVKFILDQRGQSKGPPAALWQMARSIPADNQIWLAAAGGFGELAKSAPRTGNLANMARVFSMLESATAGADLRSGLKAFVHGAARTDQDARTLADGVRGLLGLARLSTGNQPEVLKVYDGIQVEQQERTLRVNVTLTPDVFDKALSVLPRM
jgi:hypothetical protein